MPELEYIGARLPDGVGVLGSLHFHKGTLYIASVDDMGVWKEVAPLSVVQFTGIRDDSGCKIYEGDKVILFDGVVSEVSEVQKDGYFSVEFRGGYYPLRYLFDTGIICEIHLVHEKR